MNPQQNPYLVQVRYSTPLAVLLTVVGALLFLISLLLLLGGEGSPVLITGPILLLLGILAFFRPVYTFDAATGTLYAHAMVGTFKRTYGAPKGERIVTDGTRITRLTQSGGQRKVATFGTKAEDRAKLIQMLSGMQQPQQPGPQGPPQQPGHPQQQYPTY